ncbi:Os03g0787350, partial [Oryza sativa Japonica Group]
CLLLRALHALGAAAVHVLVLVVCLLLLLLLPPPHLLLDVHVVRHGLLALVELHVGVLRHRPWREDGLQGLALVRVQRVGEFHGEVDVELPLHEWPLVHRHALVVDSLE